MVTLGRSQGSTGEKDRAKELHLLQLFNVFKCFTIRLNSGN